MKFNADGYLDAGLHDLKIDEIVEHFVTAFTTSNTRPKIMQGYKKHSAEVASFGIPCTQLLDGSFASNKADPGDIDLVGFMDLDAVDALDAASQQKLRDLFAGPATKSTYLCDAYFALTVPVTHSAFGQLRSQRKYWMGEFGYDREDRPKGMIRTEVQSPPPAPPTAPPAPGTPAASTSGGGHA